MDHVSAMRNLYASFGTGDALTGPGHLTGDAAADGAVLGALVVGLGAALLVNRLTKVPTRLWVGVAAGGIAFQVVHFAEHLAQVGNWIAHPAAAPWLSPWAIAGVDALAGLTDGRRGSGAELLHLGGNLIFLAGLAAAVALLGAPRRGAHLLVAALWVQAAHVAEHLLLTATWFATGRALGVTTAFGALAAAPQVEWAARVWAHFAINLAATALALRGLQVLAGPRARAATDLIPGS